MDDSYRGPGLPGSDDDLSLFEKAMQEIEINSTKNEYEVIRQVLQELSEKYGFEFSMHDGHTLGSPMALNHRLESFSTQVGGISDEVASAIQENKFNYTMAQEVLEPIMNEDRLFTRTGEELEEMKNSAYLLVEVLLFLGQSKYSNENEFVLNQKDTMIQDIASYNSIVSTFTSYIDFIDGYIFRRPIEDRQLVEITTAVKKRMKRDRTELEEKFPEYTVVKQEIDNKVDSALETKEGVEILNSELRQILRAYSSAVKLECDNDDFRPVVDHETLNDCVRYIINS